MKGQWLWLSCQSGCFQYQRPAVRIQSSAKFILHCLLSTVLKRRKLRKRGLEWPIQKKVQNEIRIHFQNVFSVVNLSRLIVPHFVARGSGCFALMSSVAGKFGVPFSGSYTASKHALQVGLLNPSSLSPAPFLVK